VEDEAAEILRIPRVVLLVAAAAVLSAGAVARDVDNRVQLANLIPELDENGKPLVDGAGNMIERRGALFTKGPQLPGDLKLSPQDMQQINDAVGFMDCGSEVVGNYTLTTATLYGNGGQLVAQWRAIVDLPASAKGAKGDRPVGTFKKPCWLRPQGKSKLIEEELRLDPRSVQFVPSPSGELDGALALIRLRKRTSVGLPLDDSGTPLAVGTPFLHVGAVQLDATRRAYIGDPYTEPAVQACARRIDRRKAGDLMTDCSMTEEAIGSVGLVRLGGRLAIKAVFTRTGSERADGKPFNPNQAPASFSQGVELTPDVVKQMKSFEAAGAK